MAGFLVPDPFRAAQYFLMHTKIIQRFPLRGEALRHPNLPHSSVATVVLPSVLLAMPLLSIAKASSEANDNFRRK